MPSMLCHLMFAEKIYRKLTPSVSLNRIDFLSGNVLPDLSIDKNSSHFQIHTPIVCLSIPNIKKVKKVLFTLDDSLKFGMFCHLYLDYYFIKNFLIPNFIWDIDDMLVINPNNNYKWSTHDFFSNNGLYGAYTEINHLILRDGYISKELLDSIPSILPKTGIPGFDIRYAKTWREELDAYLSCKVSYTGVLLDYNTLLEFINDVANQFVSKDILLFLVNNT